VKTVRHPPGFPIPAAYSHAIEVPASARVLYIAGQIGVDAAGTVPDGIAAQTRLAFENIQAVLNTAGMALTDIVKTTVFLIEPKDFPDFAKTRTAILAGHKPASTLVFVKQLIEPRFLVEVEAIAVAE
jgi:2-iminobutanoate/2-iminopropanoate deaminase